MCWVQPLEKDKKIPYKLRRTASVVSPMVPVDFGPFQGDKAHREKTAIVTHNDPIVTNGPCSDSTISSNVSLN